MDIGFPYWIAVRRSFAPHDPFFDAGRIERELLAKQVTLDLVDDGYDRLEDMEGDFNEMNVFCPIVGCGAHLKSLDDFEEHYHARHTAACSVCSRVYPTSRLLSIHVSETHDSFFKAKVARGFPMYECLVEGCGMKFKSHKSRQQHLVDKHKFPASFEFFKKSRPSKQDRQKHRGKQSYRQGEKVKGSMNIDVQENSMQQQYQKYQQKKMANEREEVREMDMEVEQKVDELASAVSKLCTSDSTPASISFGRRHTRALTFVPRSLRNKRGPVASADSKG